MTQSIEEKRAYSREWSRRDRKLNPGKAAAQSRAWRENNPEKDKEYSRKNSHLYRKRHKEKVNLVSKKWADKNPHKTWATLSLSDHRRRGHEVTITNKELLEKLAANKNCPYCGIEYKFNSGHGRALTAPSVDRTNNENILTKENTQIICCRCNSTKLNRTHQEFIEYCTRVVDKYARPKDQEPTDEDAKGMLEDFEYILGVSALPESDWTPKIRAAIMSPKRTVTREQIGKDADDYGPELAGDK